MAHTRKSQQARGTQLKQESLSILRGVNKEVGHDVSVKAKGDEVGEGEAGRGVWRGCCGQRAGAKSEEPNVR